MAKDFFNIGNYFGKSGMRGGGGGFFTEPDISNGPAGGGPLPGPSNGRVGNPFPDVRRNGYPWPDVRKGRMGLFDSQQPSGAGGGPRAFSTPTPPFYPGPTRSPFPFPFPQPAPSNGTVPGPPTSGGGVPGGGGTGAPPWYGPWNTPAPGPLPGTSNGPASPDMFPTGGGNGTIPGGGGAPGPGLPGQTFPGGNGTIPSSPGLPDGTGTSPLPPGTQMSPLNPAILYGILSYLASTPALGHGQEMLQQYQTPQIQQALAQMQQQMPSAWLPQIRAQLYGSPYSSLF